MGTVTIVMSVRTQEEDFRNIVLRGTNVASYKFALAKAILTLAESGSTSASLEELAVQPRLKAVDVPQACRIRTQLWA